jgi:hypothetical protein
MSIVIRVAVAPKRKGGTDIWKKRQSEELRKTCLSYEMIRVIKSRRVRLVGQEACMKGTRNSKKFQLEILKGKDYSENAVVH